MSPSSSVFQDDCKPNSRPSDNSSSLAFEPSYVRILEFNQGWSRVSKDRLNELIRLKTGWDGYRASPLNFHIAMFALQLIDRLYVEGVSCPGLVPGADGTLQIEWHENQYDVELDILGAYYVKAYRYCHRTGVEEEYTLTNEFGVAWGWIQDLKG